MLSIVVGRCIRNERWIGAQKGLGVFLFGIFLAFALVHTWGPTALGAQTREQCDKCCQTQNADEYYAEQCKLKCFRNPDSCMDQKSMRKQAPPPPPAAEAPKQQPAPSAAEATPRQPSPSAEPPRQLPKRSAFRLPNPLNLTPGREGDAAAQILALNGVPPQHPQYAAALQAMQNVLVNFARTNPSGGKLPTAQLENILRQLR